MPNIRIKFRKPNDTKIALCIHAPLTVILLGAAPFSRAALKAKIVLLKNTAKPNDLLVQVS